MHRPPNGPRDSDPFDGFLRQQRQRIRRVFDQMTTRRLSVMREVMASTGYHWEPPRGNVKGSPGRGHYPRNGS